MSCANGASVKAGIDPSQEILVDRSLWETVTGAPSSWFDWLLDIFTFQTIKASDLCALNLSDPTLPSVDVLAAAFLRDPSSVIQVWNYIRDKLRYAAFARTCVCNPSPGSTCTWTGSETPPSTGFSGGVTYGTRFTVVTACDLTDVQVWTDISTGGTTKLELYENAGGTLVWSASPASPDNSFFTYTLPTPYHLVAGLSYTVAWVIPASHTYRSGGMSASWPSDPMITYLTSAGNFGSDAYPNTVLGGRVAIGFCHSGATSTPAAPVIETQPPELDLPPAWGCTSISDICARLQQLDQKLQWLIKSAPIVTSTSVSEGTAHAGLTGHGTIAVAGIVGFKWDLTTIPPVYGSSPGSPTFHFGLGRVSWETGEGWIGEQQLFETPYTLQELPPGVVTIGYSLSPGVVATITELHRGP